MVRPPGGFISTARSALGSGNTNVIYLRYADGSEQHASDYDACSGTVPAFDCSYAPTLVECQSQIQAYLDHWFADFNVVFTLTRPTHRKYYTAVISSGGGAWCGVNDRVAGIAPFVCKDLAGGVAYAFYGGRNSRETAVIVAQELAHLVGLEHTANPRDVMYPSICSDCGGFVDDDSAVVGDICDRSSQNSYKLLQRTLGAWPGGDKPSAFADA